MPYDRDKLYTELLGHDGGFEELLSKKPLLAHYTSVDVAEKILKDEKIWLSNPLLMNDLEELRYGIKLGATLLRESPKLLEACGTEDRKKILVNTFNAFLEQFETNDALDVYVFCLSEIEAQDNDGQLPMWHSYGSLPMWHSYGSAGNGAAIVFNTAFIVNTDDPAPLLICKVDYITSEQRYDLLESKVTFLCDNIKRDNPTDAQLVDYASIFFHVIKLLALINKHTGFSYEREWRAIYLKEVAGETQKEKFKFDYFLSPQGIQPKLIFHLKPDAGDDWTFEKIIQRIILGPSISTHLSKLSFMRMLQVIERPELKKKVVASTIPLRPKAHVS